MLGTGLVRISTRASCARRSSMIERVRSVESPSMTTNIWNPDSVENRNADRCFSPPLTDEKRQANRLRLIENTRANLPVMIEERDSLPEGGDYRSVGLGSTV